MIISNDIQYIGVNDHQIDLFEGQYVVPHGMSYNSYAILDEKIAIMDTVDRHFTQAWLDNIQSVLQGRKPDYLVVQHMEPDHSANIANFLAAYPESVVVTSQKALTMIQNYFGTDYPGRHLLVDEGDTLKLGKHELHFVTAPMVHWPEVIVTYDAYDKVLFSADGFGKFGALDVEEPWADEARRYYIGIVGKYGAQVQKLLKKAATLDIAQICPLHGPVLKENLGYYLHLYDLWSSYQPESEGIVVAYTSVYGHTKAAVEELAQKLREKHSPQVVVYDLARCDMSQAVADAFRYSKLVLATTTYNGDIFPFMREFIDHLTERNFQKRTVALVENGSWGPAAVRVMTKMLAESKDLTFVKDNVTILSALNDTSRDQMEAMAEELCRDYLAWDNETANKQDRAAMHKLGYGLYVVTTQIDGKDNGCIVNSIMQLTTSPARVAVSISKKNYSHEVVQKTGILNVNCLDTSAPFSLIERYGFQSGRTADKFAEVDELRSDNGLRFLPRHINAFMSLKVEDCVDMGTHSLFICSVTESRDISDRESMTYAYYQDNVKPAPATEGKKGYVCKICGWVYEGETLPDDLVCPLCKHGASDFEKIQ